MILMWGTILDKQVHTCCAVPTALITSVMCPVDVCELYFKVVFMKWSVDGEKM